MKIKGLKIISLFILLAMFFTTFGCNSTPEATTPSGSGGLRGEASGGIYIYNIEDYNELLQTNKNIPDDFLTADMLRELGSFNGIVNSDQTDWRYYHYTFIHEDKYRIAFDVCDYHSTMPIIDASLLGPTMISLTEKTRGRFAVDGFEYIYKEGRLIYIQWAANDKSFVIDLTGCTHEQLEEMPNTLSEDSILRKLLSKDAEDQITAFNQLKDMVTK